MKELVLDKLLALKKRNQCGLAVLIDPDKVELNQIEYIASTCNESQVDFIFIGGSLVSSGQMEEIISQLKRKSNCPIVIFPGGANQIFDSADAILLLCLISGRNPEFLIGQHVLAAPLLKASSLEVISTGYILIDGGRPTSVSYMSNTQPIPHNKIDIALSTAWAGAFMGNQLIYLEAGSGALQTVSAEMVKKISSNIEIPLIVGGGINSPEKAQKLAASGANLLVVGTAIEQNLELLPSISIALKKQFQVKPM